MKFEEITGELSKISENKEKKSIESLRKECICHTCPTYTSCARKRDELLFCMINKSGCPIDERICLCPQNCPVHSRYEFESFFYCSRGTERERIWRKPWYKK